MKLFVVRGENRGEPESYLLGVYATLEEAKARVLEIEHVCGLELAWFDDVELGETVMLSNR